MRNFFASRRDRIIQEVPLGNEAHEDEVGDFPTKKRNGNDVHARQLGYKISVILNVILVFAVYGQVNLLQMLMPLKRDIPWVVQIGDINNTTVRTKILKPGSDGERILSEWEAARYVTYRYEVVPVASEMSRRWADKCVAANDRGYVDDMCGYIALRSTEPVYAQFLAENSDINALIKKSISRVVSFDSQGIFKGYRTTSKGSEIQWEFRITVAEYGQPVGRATFDCSDEKYQGQENGKGCFLINKTKLIVQMWTRFDHLTGSYQNRFLNQQGFMVTDFVPTPVIGNKV
jgi:type IV secretory pathway component VirB8